MSNTTTPSVVAIGELLWDMLPDGRKPGGAPANFIYHVAQNGVRGTTVTAVGDDELGCDLVSILADNDVNVAAQVNDYPTGITAVRLDDGGIPEYDVVKGVAWDHIEFTDECAASYAAPTRSATAPSPPARRGAPATPSTG